ncbi:ATP-dependent DNA helicase, partial [Mediterraneibacter glycyrrhizinilyticus]|nr:ATP-dependent DNA helicase [Mediterraneibacter glycyrrhizinilyticus]
YKGSHLKIQREYAFMRHVIRRFFQKTFHLCQEAHQLQRNMGEHEREDFLKEFERDRENSLVGFCVMGGVFSEGIDLTADR